MVEIIRVHPFDCLSVFTLNVAEKWLYTYILNIRIRSAFITSAIKGSLVLSKQKLGDYKQQPMLSNLTTSNAIRFRESPQTGIFEKPSMPTSIGIRDGTRFNFPFNPLIPLKARSLTSLLCIFLLDVVVYSVYCFIWVYVNVSSIHSFKAEPTINTIFINHLKN